VVIAAESAAKNAKLKLINGMAILLKDIEAVINLLNSVKANIACALEDILIA
jgi:hypothetical protein